MVQSMQADGPSSERSILQVQRTGEGDAAVDACRALAETTHKQLVTQGGGSLSELPEQQAAVISMRYGIGDGILEPLSMTAIGQILHMSRDRVRNLEHKALRTLKETSGSVEEYL